ncbi:hypothetical protein BJI67_09560 [Acidihalobacter aeolianus]|uniref:Uncharacterized protein n=2 Tax=Acidihalobacter TaxID=1765964 RepID=A0A1D8K8J5_9GAMM|nr:MULTISPECIES: hypothetical protein [Acidihalobacter]AOV17277.1 hypothetical protein BJI67_09560 [Acidihalobacter aeolianus]OBS10388.1 hypothetical protein Thpro_020104 [Acidihalobacter prosperus]
MKTDLWLLLLLAASLVLSALTLLGYRHPAWVRARSSGEVLRRHGVAALVCYLLMALLLSVHDIDRRGYDRQFESAAPAVAAAHHGRPTAN